MADKKIMVDSTILIDYFRKTDKSKSRLVKLSINYNKLYISTITEFEVINGATLVQLDFWNHMLKGFTILDFDSKAARQAAIIVQQLKTKRKSIDKPDLFIAATAVSHGLTLDTANKKHFEFVESLNLLGE
jgi:tRNA(fMet)-specific endonuclease VapC